MTSWIKEGRATVAHWKKLKASGVKAGERGGFLLDHYMDGGRRGDREDLSSTIVDMAVNVGLHVKDEGHAFGPILLAVQEETETEEFLCESESDDLVDVCKAILSKSMLLLKARGDLPRDRIFTIGNHVGAEAGWEEEISRAIIR